MKNNQQGFSVVSVLVVVLTLGLITVTGLYIGNNKTTEVAQNNTIEPATSDKKSSADEPASATYPVNGFATGQVVFREEFSDYFDVLMNSSLLEKPAEAIWVEYGESPVALSGKTREVAEELGLGGDGYGSWVVTIPDGTFSDGRTYFYRAAARLQDNSTIYGGIASFNAPK